MKKTKKMPQRKPVQLRSQQTRDAILKAAAHILLSKNGLSGLNSNAIAERAGVSIGSFYQYYGNKEAVLSELIESRMAYLAQVLSESMARVGEKEGKRPRAFLQSLMIRLLTEFRNDRLLALLMFSYSHVIADQARMEKVEVDLVPMLVHAIRSTVPGLRKKNLELAVFVMLQSYRGIVAIYSARGFKNIEIEPLAEEMTDLFWRYLSDDCHPSVKMIG